MIQFTYNSSIFACFFSRLSIEFGWECVFVELSVAFFLFRFVSFLQCVHDIDVDENLECTSYVVTNSRRNEHNVCVCVINTINYT